VAAPAKKAASAHVAAARFYSVLSDPTRLSIISLLLVRPHTVGELVTEIGVPQSRISNHLACLRWCRVVTAERRGRQMIYAIADLRLGRLLDLTDDLVDGIADHLANCQRVGPDWT
jgi:ArsR family transcriptional regulator, cadmium/lead-responsive transcriptional repressor